jgi:hypothetical protein
VIGTRELQQLRAEWTLDIPVIEKDYVLGWLLAGIAQHQTLAGTWVFKGGTCLRKCYYETFRFSEDLDFTVTAGGPEEPEELGRSSQRSPNGSARSPGSHSNSTTKRSSGGAIYAGIRRRRGGSPIRGRTRSRWRPR